VTLRLDTQTRARIARIARRRRVSASHVIREAVQALVIQEEAAVPVYETIADLVGLVHGGNPKRSTGTGRQFADLLKRRARA
jgi:hypothetical protein